MSAMGRERRRGEFVAANHALPPVHVDASGWPREAGPRKSGDLVSANHALPPVPIGIHNAATPSTPLKIFCCYSHQDREFREYITDFVATERKGLGTTWTDNQIPTGPEWRKEIERAIDNSDMFLFLVSANFLVSDCCCLISQMAILRGQAKGSRIFLVHVPSEKVVDTEPAVSAARFPTPSEIREILDAERPIYTTSYEAPTVP